MNPNNVWKKNREFYIGVAGTVLELSLIHILDRIEAVLDEPELPDNGNQHILSQAQPDQPEVQFSDVAFAYQMCIRDRAQRAAFYPAACSAFGCLATLLPFS